MPQTLFKVEVRGIAVDLRGSAFSNDEAHFLDKTDHSYCQAFAALAREAPVDAIVYQSVRDPLAGGCVAVLAPTAFARKKPISPETWNLSVNLDRVIWQKNDVLSPEAFEFPATLWR